MPHRWALVGRQLSEPSCQQVLQLARWDYGERGLAHNLTFYYNYLYLTYNMGPSQLQILFHTEFIFFPSSPPAHITLYKHSIIFSLSSSIPLPGESSHPLLLLEHPPPVGDLGLARVVGESGELREEVWDGEDGVHRGGRAAAEKVVTKIKRKGEIQGAAGKG